MLPPRKALFPAAIRPWCMALDVEDFPLEPVTAMMGEGVNLRKSEMSVSTAFAARI